MILKWNEERRRRERGEGEMEVAKGLEKHWEESGRENGREKRRIRKGARAEGARCLDKEWRRKGRQAKINERYTASLRIRCYPPTLTSLSKRLRREGGGCGKGWKGG